MHQLFEGLSLTPYALAIQGKLNLVVFRSTKVLKKIGNVGLHCDVHMIYYVCPSLLHHWSLALGNACSNAPFLDMLVMLTMALALLMTPFMLLARCTESCFLGPCTMGKHVYFLGTERQALTPYSLVLRGVLDLVVVGSSGTWQNNPTW